MKHYTQYIGQDKSELLKIRIEEVLNDIRNRGIISFRGRDCLTGYSYGEVYDWDMYFENIFLSYFSSCKYSRNGVESFLETQLSNGFISRTAGYVHKNPRQHFKPFLAQMTWLYIRDCDNVRWLTYKYYLSLVKSIDYWFWYLDLDKNGLCVWNSADHSGMDNQCRRAGDLDQVSVEGVDLNCYLVRELDAMKLIAEKLGKIVEAENFAKRSDELKQKIRDILWDEEDNFFYDRDERLDKLVKVKTCVAFLTLWAGVATKEQADKLVREHLLNTDEFWLEYPVATWSKDEFDYYQGRKGGECSWMGATWIPVNYMIFHGLMDYGYMDVAKDLAYKTFDMVLNEDVTREYYNAETGTGDGLSPFWGWSTLGYVMPLEYEKNYNPSALNSDKMSLKIII